MNIKPSDAERSFYALHMALGGTYRHEHRDPSLEQDIRESASILSKLKSSDKYRQHLYAALCNNKIIHIETGFDDSVTWRESGGLVTSIAGDGDYMDYYCSGIWTTGSDDYVEEGEVTDEIKSDLNSLGWELHPYNT